MNEKDIHEKGWQEVDGEVVVPNAEPALSPATPHINRREVAADPEYEFHQRAIEESVQNHPAAGNNRSKPSATVPASESSVLRAIEGSDLPLDEATIQLGKGNVQELRKKLGS